MIGATAPSGSTNKNGGRVGPADARAGARPGAEVDMDGPEGSGEIPEPGINERGVQAHRPDRDRSLVEVGRLDLRVILHQVRLILHR